MKFQCFGKQLLNYSTTLPRMQLPSPMETHVWYMIPSEVKSQSVLNHYAEILSPCEKELVFEMLDEELRKRALLARALVRTTIARYQINSQVSLRSLKFMKNVHGKPEIGIDVEEKHRRIKHNILSFARRYFSKLEVQMLSAISDPQVQQQEFIKLWTLKHMSKHWDGASRVHHSRLSHSKAATKGTFIGNSISEASEIVVDSFDDAMDLATNWKFVLLDLTGNHYAAICTKTDCAIEGKQSTPKKLTVWKTIPFVEDKCVSGTKAVVIISVLS